MNIYERRRKALQHLLDYWEQSIGMLKAVEYTATTTIFIDAIRWRKAINEAIQKNETNYVEYKRQMRKEGRPPWGR